MTPETPSTPGIEQPQTQQETQLTPEQKRDQEILGVLKEKYGVDLQKFIKEQSDLKINLLKMDIQNPNQAQIEKKAKEIYEAYLKSEIEKPGGVEKTVNIENLVENTGNDKIKKLKEQFDKVLDPILNKYDFLDTQTKNFVKLGISNSLFKGPIGDITDSLIGSFGNFVNELGNLDEAGLQRLANGAIQNPVETGRGAGLETLFKQKMSDLSKKLEEINTILNKNDPKLNQTEKQNIISNVEWFRNPSIIESGVVNLDISSIDTKKTSKNDIPLDNEKLTKYMLESRENIMQLSKKLDLGVGIGDKLYALSNNPILGKFPDKIMETILKLPLVGKLIAILLGLDPNNAIGEYKENSKNFKLLSSLKSLGKRKENGNDVAGKKPFEDIDLSQLNFNDNKTTLKSISSTLGDIKEDKDTNFWEKAFNEPGYDTGDGKPKFKLKLGNNGVDKKISNDELKKIVDEGIKEYKDAVSKITPPQTTTPAANPTQSNSPTQNPTTTSGTQETQTTTPTETTEVVNPQIKENALKLLKGETINGLSNTLNFGDYNDFKKINLEDIKNNNDVDSLLKKAIGEGSIVNGSEIEKSDYEELSKDVKDSLKYAIKIIKDFFNENKSFSTYGEWDSGAGRDLAINDIIYDKDFKDYLSKK